MVGDPSLPSLHPGTLVRQSTEPSATRSRRAVSAPNSASSRRPRSVFEPHGGVPLRLLSYCSNSRDGLRHLVEERGPSQSAVRVAAPGRAEMLPGRVRAGSEGIPRCQSRSPSEALGISLPRSKVSELKSKLMRFVTKTSPTRTEDQPNRLL